MRPHRGQITTTDLLAWATANSSTISTVPDAGGNTITDEYLRNRESLDPEWIDVILGSSSSKLMKEFSGIYSDRAQPLDKREGAMIEFENLILDIDNSNNIQKLKLWTPFLDIIKCEGEDVRLRVLGVKIIVSAIQNNPTALSDFLNLNDGLNLLLSLLDGERDPELQFYIASAVSWCIANSSETLNQFVLKNGFSKLSALLSSGASRLSLKIVFALSNLLCSDDSSIRSKTLINIINNGIPAMVMDLINNQPDTDLHEKCYIFLSEFANAAEEAIDDRILAEAKAEVSTFLRNVSPPKYS